jgi:hypothetical protein
MSTRPIVPLDPRPPVTAAVIAATIILTLSLLVLMADAMVLALAASA